MHRALEEICDEMFLSVDQTIKLINKSVWLMWGMDVYTSS